jgi:Enterobacterial TraT complement resistance protein
VAEILSLQQARFLLQANVLQVGRTSRAAAEGAFAKGFGSALIGGAGGAGLGRVASDQTEAMIAGAVAGAAASVVADAFVQDVTYSIITDVQISERAGEGLVTQRMTQEIAQGSSGQRILSATQVHDWKRYHTRLMSSANQVNLDFEDAAPDLWPASPVRSPASFSSLPMPREWVHREGKLAQFGEERSAGWLSSPRP